MSRMRGHVLWAARALAVALAWLLMPAPAEAQFFGGGMYGYGFPAYGYGYGYGFPGYGLGYGYGYPGIGYGMYGYGFPGYGLGYGGFGGLGYGGFGGLGYGGFGGLGYGGFGYGGLGAGLGYGIFGGGLGYAPFGTVPTGYLNPLWGLGLSPLGVQSALTERYLLGRGVPRVAVSATPSASASPAPSPSISSLTQPAYGPRLILP